MSFLLLLLAQAPAPEPSPHPAPTPALSRSGPTAPRSLGDIRLKTGRAEAEKKLATSSGTARPQAEEDVPEREEPPNPHIKRRTRDSEHRDNDGNGEAYWRARAVRIEAKVREAELLLARAEEEMSVLSGSSYGGSRHGASSSSELARKEAAVARAKRRLAAARGEMDSLREEARKSGAYPGWLR